MAFFSPFLFLLFQMAYLNFVFFFLFKSNEHRNMKGRKKGKEINPNSSEGFFFLVFKSATPVFEKGASECRCEKRKTRSTEVTRIQVEESQVTMCQLVRYDTEDTWCSGFILNVRRDGQ